MQEDYEKFNQDHHNQGEKDLISFEKYINQAIELSATYITLETLKEGVFEFSKYPALQRKINLLLKDFNLKTTQKIDFYVEKHYRKSASKPFIHNGKNIPFEEVKKHLEAFKNRPERLLSERVWNITEQVRTEIEMALDLAISDGVSAKHLASELKKYLKNPDVLFRRYRDKNGNLQLSKKAKEFHSGRGVYRSAYKNAERLARTEINIAYRTADLDRWQTLDFVSGYEIKRSKHPFGCKICEMMKGKYPKTFLWVGNHPNCRCYMTPIFAKDIQKVAINENLVQWVRENQEKLNDKLPFFLQNNQKEVERILEVEKRRKEYERFLNDVNYNDVYFNEKTGGLKATHRLHNFDPNRGHFEKEARDVLYKGGYKVILEKELADKGEIVFDGVKHIDGYLNDKSFDISTILGEGKNTIKKAFQHSASKEVQVAVLYFPDERLFSMERVYQGLKMFKGNLKYEFKDIILIVNNSVFKL